MDTLVVSPHLDDAVFSCGTWLAAHRGALVVTLFAGQPPDAAWRLTDWDAACGFASVADAMQCRKKEDAAALSRLGARPCWLDFLDSQYLDSPSEQALADAIARLIAQYQPARLLLPMGLVHSDHMLAHAAALHALAHRPGVQAWAYEEAMYRARDGVLAHRLDELRSAGLEPTLVWHGQDAEPDHWQAKAAAVAAYASEVPWFSEDSLADTRRPERFWQLAAARPLHG